MISHVTAPAARRDEARASQTPVRSLSDKSSCASAPRSVADALRIAQRRAFEQMAPEALAAFREEHRLSLVALGAHFGVDRRAVAARLKGTTAEPLLKPGMEAWASLSREEAATLRETLSHREIAVRFGVSVCTVNTRFAAWKLPLPDRSDRRWPGSDDWRALSPAELACLHHERKLSLVQIAARYGVHPTTVCKRFRDLGIFVERRRQARSRRVRWIDLPADMDARGLR